MSNPVDDYLDQRAVEKLAASRLNTVRTRMAQGLSDYKPWGEMFVHEAKKQLEPGPVAKAVVGGGLFAGGMGLIGAVGKVMQAITKKRDFDAMLEANPDLERMRAQDEVKFNRHYNSFRSLNPRFAADPVVAASYMHHISESPSRAGQIIVQSLKDRPKEEMKMELPFPSGSGKTSFTYG